MRRAYLCDFDGTVSPTDVGNAFFAHFTAGARAEWDALMERWLSGALGARDCLRAECELVRIDRQRALAFTRRFAIDAGFAPFCRAALARGDAVMVVSEGLDFYVGDHLERAGLADVPWAANRARFEPGDSLRVEFPHADPACQSCGNCKAQYARRYRAQGFHVVMVGDGLSDRCGARAANEVVAGGELLAWCREQGIEAEPLAGFSALAARAAAAAAS
jgi:2,3-diketo-5-methylthio-1-phosphopentane phosphatase